MLKNLLARHAHHRYRSECSSEPRPARTPVHRVFAALSDPARRGMVERLSGGSASVTELATDYAMTLSAVVQHLTALQGSGLEASRKAGRVRTFTVEPDTLRSARRWIEARKRGWHRDLDHPDAVHREKGP